MPSGHSSAWLYTENAYVVGRTFAGRFSLRSNVRSMDDACTRLPSVSATSLAQQAHTTCVNSLVDILLCHSWMIEQRKASSAHSRKDTSTSSTRDKRSKATRLCSTCRAGRSALRVVKRHIRIGHVLEHVCSSSFFLNTARLSRTNTGSYYVVM